MQSDDFYEVLGVSRDATAAEIKKQYYKLAKKLHPDQNSSDPQAGAKFAKLQNAYEVLSDDKRRAQYDQFGAEGANMEGGFPGGVGFDAEDLLSQMFGGGFRNAARGGAANAVRRGAAIHTQVSIPFMDAVNGTTRHVTVYANASCDSCDGTGSKDKSKPTTCKACRGSGQQTVQRGFFAMSTPCNVCNGEGMTVPNPCKDCRGSGVKRKSKTIEVAIPAGVDNDVNVRLQGQGDAGERGGPAGHVFVQIKVEPDPFFERDGADVHVKVPVSVSQCALGATVSIPTLKGEVDLKVPAGSQPGDQLLLRGRGIKKLNSTSHGNQYVHLNLVIPKKLTERQKTLYEDLKKEEESAKDSGVGSVLRDTIDRIKRYVSGS